MRMRSLEKLLALLWRLQRARSDTWAGRDGRERGRNGRESREWKGEQEKLKGE